MKKLMGIVWDSNDKLIGCRIKDDNEIKFLSLKQVYDIVYIEKIEGIRPKRDKNGFWYNSVTMYRYKPHMFEI